MTMPRIDRLPAELGFRMPPEWHPHTATWLSWPHNQETWPNNLANAQQEYLALINAIASDERIVLNFATAELAARAGQSLKRLSLEVQRNIQTTICPTNDAWIRDYGPTFVTNASQISAVDWRYNAWGGKYPPYEDDQQFVNRMLSLGSLDQLLSGFAVAEASSHSTGARCPSHLFSERSLECPNDRPILHYNSELCFEGGAIETDEAPVAMCTKSCVLDPNRNPDWTLESIERELLRCLGVENVIWLSGDALAGDDTNGHIDQLARFAPGQKILIASCNDQSDPQHDLLNQNFHDLVSELSARNLDYELVPLPLPEPVIYQQVRLPASYCNFYITNGSVIVPTFDQRDSDNQAMDIISSAFPDRKVIGLPSKNLCVGLGAFHCLTQQQPQVGGDHFA